VGLRTVLSLLASVLLAISLGIVPVAMATPPDHAPAHGYRAKHKNGTNHKTDTRYEKDEEAKRPPKGSVEVIYDSERGIYVAVGMPDVFYHDGHYYRRHDGRWQMSVRGNGGWEFSISGQVPALVVDADSHQPGPAHVKPEKDE